MKNRLRLSLTVFALLLVVAARSNAQSSETAARPRILFVCEHGAAKSVIAAAYFNQLAAERGLRERATYRGASPQAELSVATLKGLREDGLTLPTAKPSPITSDDVRGATHIFAIGCSLPGRAASSGKAENWTDVPEVSDGYPASRDAIKKHVERLIDELQKR
jgi:protein-tyrosine-phosphatase